MFAIGLMLLLVVPASAGATADLGMVSCTRLEIRDHHLLHITSGAEVPSQSGMILTDTEHGRLLRLSPDGNVYPFFENEPGWKPERPSMVWRSASGHYWIEDERKKFDRDENELSPMDLWLELDADFKYRGRKKIGDREAGSYSVDSIYSWAPLDGDKILALADLRGDSWLTAFIVVDLGKLGEPAHVLSVARERDFKKLGYLSLPNIQQSASIGELGFVLRLTGAPAVYRVSVEGPESTSELEQLPGLGELPDFELPTSLRGSRKQAAQFDLFERATSPVGIFALDGKLFLLAREADGLLANWALVEIDPRSGAELRTVDLPFHSPYLLLIPGTEFLSFVEQKRVDSPQEGSSLVAQSLTRIPVARLKAQSSSISIDECEALRPQRSAGSRDGRGLAR